MAVTTNPVPPHVDTDLEGAWRLAFVVVADKEVATKAVGRALSELGPGATAVQPMRTDLFATTLRLSLSRAAESPDMEPDSAVTSALWQLPAQQRAALWLSKVTELDNTTLGIVLGVSAIKAGEVAGRATEWLDVALDHESGPLCQHEAKLADFIDGHLPLVEAAEIDDHLPGCPTCQTKVGAFEALADLKAGLSRAVPDAPGNLEFQARQQQDATPASDGEASMDDTGRRAPAVRPLAFCCAGLLVLGLLGVPIVRSGTHSSTTPTTSSNAGATGVEPGSAGAGTSGGTGTANPSARLSGSETPIVTAPTTTIQPVTFPTIPPGGPTKPARR